MEKAGLALFQDNMRFITEAARIEAPPPPDWATANRILLDMDTMRLREVEEPGVRCRISWFPASLRRRTAALL